MKTLRILTTLALTLLSCIAVAAQGTPATTVPVQADVETVYTLPDGTQTRSNGRFFRSRHGQTREDSRLGAVITDLKAGTVTILVAQTKDARVMRIPASERVPPRANRPAHQLFEETTIEGRRITKAKMKGPHGQEVEFWTARDVGVVTFTKSELNGMTTVRQLKNLSTLDPDPTLFMIPADYTRVEQQLAPLGARPEPKFPERPAPGSPRGRGRGGIH